MKTIIKVSKRPTEILRLLSDGYSNEEIHNILSISTKSVENHVHHLYELLNDVLQDNESSAKRVKIALLYLSFYNLKNFEHIPFINNFYNNYSLVLTVEIQDKTINIISNN